jgi:hypothetical protein
VQQPQPRNPKQVLLVRQQGTGSKGRRHYRVTQRAIGARDLSVAVARAWSCGTTIERLYPHPYVVMPAADLVLPGHTTRTAMRDPRTEIAASRVQPYHIASQEYHSDIHHFRDPVFESHWTSCALSTGFSQRGEQA